MPEKISPCRQVFVARKLGFCNGVRQALETVENVLQQNTNCQKIFIYNEIVHNSFVVNSLKNRGIHFCHTLDEVPADSIIIWSAHGVAPAVVRQAQQRGLQIVDATCPLVRRLHDLATSYTLAGYTVIFIGQVNHPETIGVLGCGNIYCVNNTQACFDLPDFPENQPVKVLTQTTLNPLEVEKLLAALRERYPQLEATPGICYATCERQQAVSELLQNHHIDQFLVIGSPSSSNSNQLCRIAEQSGVPSRLLDDPEELYDCDLSNINNLGVTAGASAPEILLKKTLDILKQYHKFAFYEEKNG